MSVRHLNLLTCLAGVHPVFQLVRREPCAAAPQTTVLHLSRSHPLLQTFWGLLWALFDTYRAGVAHLSEHASERVPERLRNSVVQ